MDRKTVSPALTFRAGLAERPLTRTNPSVINLCNRLRVTPTFWPARKWSRRAPPLWTVNSQLDFWRGVTPQSFTVAPTPRGRSLLVLKQTPLVRFLHARLYLLPAPEPGYPRRISGANCHLATACWSQRPKASPSAAG